ncbi:hypothetical protein KSP40_PGU017112 [Platanthera guangdongensis]|uniref:Uncharacterized protein n=1 Tax=Platanthera guangdongensis TaxID=2320717 RepID=A0ABR2LQN8_9ASPA
MSSQVKGIHPSGNMSTREHAGSHSIHRTPAARKTRRLETSPHSFNATGPSERLNPLGRALAITLSPGIPTSTSRQGSRHGPFGKTLGRSHPTSADGSETTPPVGRAGSCTKLPKPIHRHGNPSQLQSRNPPLLHLARWRWSKAIDWKGMAKLIVADEARKEFANLCHTFDEVNQQLQTKLNQVFSYPESRVSLLLKFLQWV